MNESQIMARAKHSKVKKMETTTHNIKRKKNPFLTLFIYYYIFFFFHLHTHKASNNKQLVANMCIHISVDIYIYI